MNAKKITAAALLAAALTLTTAASCDAQPTAPVEQEQDDCDWGDLHQATPDEDCGGITFGTPKPKTPVRKTSGPAPRITRRR